MAKENTELGTPTQPGREELNEIWKYKSLIFQVILSIGLLGALIILARQRNVISTTMRPFDLNDKSLKQSEMPYTIKSAKHLVINTVIILGVTIASFGFECKLHKKNILWILSTMYFTIMGACFTIILVHFTKCWAGNLRPYFLDACKPNQTMVMQLTTEQKTTWVDEQMTKMICTNKESLKYRWSFPSGLSAEAWYASTLSILFIHHIDVKYTDHCYTLMLALKAIFQFGLFTFATWVAISRTLDFHHFWWDVVAGSLLGLLIAVAMFYMFVKPVHRRAAKESCFSSCGKDSALFTKLEKLGCTCCAYVEGTTEGEESHEMNGRS